MNILVACEYSGIVRDAFIRKGHNAVSCDILDTESPGPHIKDDVLKHLDDGWDMMIAHPPCTYLSRAGARWLYHGGKIDEERYGLGLEARAFFMELLSADIERIAIENPTPLKIYKLPQPSQDLQPCYFGHGYTKRTLLWLKNLPPLFFNGRVVDTVPLMPSNTSGKSKGQKYHYTSITSKEASRTFQGIADAMADQWG